MITRSSRILALSLKDSHTNTLLNIPRYESSKGLSNEYQNIAIRSYNQEKEAMEKKSNFCGFEREANVLQEQTQTDAFLEEAKEMGYSIIQEKNIDVLDNDNLDNTPDDPFENSGSTQYFPSDESCDSDYEAKETTVKRKRKSKKKTNGAKTVSPNLDVVRKNKNKKNNEFKVLSEECAGYSDLGKDYLNNGNQSDMPNISLSNNKAVDSVKIIAATPAVLNPLDHATSIKICFSQKQENTGMRIRDKTHCCMFCYKQIQQLARHFEVVHSEEKEAFKILALPKKSKERREGFTLLSRVGDHYHNCEVLTRKQGELILVRRPTSEEALYVTHMDYGPCPDCLGFMIKKHIWHHLKYSCTKVRNKFHGNTLRRNPISESTALLVHTFGADICEAFRDNIILKLRSDPITLICQQDLLILKFGTMQYEKYQNTQCELIRQSVRQLGRLLKELRKLDPLKLKLENWLMPENFDTVVAAVRNVCCFSLGKQTRSTPQTPSLALKLGYSLKKCITILMGIALRKTDTEHYKKLRNFQTLMELEWVVKISSNALATLYDRKLNAVELLPLTDDLVQLNKYINRNIASTKHMLMTFPTYNTWCSLANLILSKVILFNKRRSGEASRMTLVQYSTRGNWAGVDEFSKSFSPLEEELAKKLTLVQIKGKRGKHVNVLLSPDVKDCIDLLIKTREEFEFSKENPYVFARGGSSILNIRGHDALRKICNEARLIRPELINGTKLRKYIATVYQIFNMTENETDWLARHLGHDIRVHREFYRLQESSVELTKVSRLLIAIENGDAHKFQGKSLDDINVNDLPQLDEEHEPEYVDSDNEEGESEASSTLKNPERKDDTQKKEKPHTRKNKAKKKVVKRAWSDQESNAVLSFFKSSIRQGTVPGKEACEDCINKSDTVLISRRWTDVKNYVYNYIKKIKNVK